MIKITLQTESKHKKQDHQFKFKIKISNEPQIHTFLRWYKLHPKNKHQFILCPKDLIQIKLITLHSCRFHLQTGQGRTKQKQTRYLGYIDSNKGWKAVAFIAVLTGSVAVVEGNGAPNACFTCAAAGFAFRHELIVLYRIYDSIKL